MERLARWTDEAFPRTHGSLLSLATWFVSQVASPSLDDRRVHPDHPYLQLRRFVSPFVVWEVVGNPLRPPPRNPSWLTDDVLALAGGIYEELAFDRMPILADALQDAGCDNDAILGRCRGDGPHVRGCWVVDLVLGKE